MNDSEAINVKVLAVEVKGLASQVNKLEAKLDAYASHFVTAEVYELKHKELELQVAHLGSRIDTMSRTNALQKWLIAGLSGLGGIVVSFLTQFYFTHLGGR